MNAELYESDLYENDKINKNKIDESLDTLKRKILNIFKDTGVDIKTSYTKHDIYNSNIITVETDVTKPFVISKLKYYLSKLCSSENINFTEDQGNFGFYSKVFSFNKKI